MSYNSQIQVYSLFTCHHSTLVTDHPSVNTSPLAQNVGDWHQARPQSLEHPAAKNLTCQPGTVVQASWTTE